jgi:hypothetical protein
MEFYVYTLHDCNQNTIKARWVQLECLHEDTVIVICDKGGKVFQYNNQYKIILYYLDQNYTIEFENLEHCQTATQCLSEMIKITQRNPIVFFFIISI